MKTKDLKTNAIFNVIRTICSVLFPLVSFPYVSRVLGVGNLGIYNYSASIISYFLLFAGLGISTYAIREGSQLRNDYMKICQFANQVFSINIISTLISLLALLFLVLFSNKLHSYRISLLILSAEIFFTTLGCSWIYNIYEDFVFIAIRNILFQFVSLVLLFILVHSPDDLYVYLLIISGTNALSNIINFIYARLKFCPISFTLRFQLKKHIKPILIIFSTSIAITIYVSADTTMIGLYYDDIAVGLYSTAVKVYSLVKQILAAIMMVLIPRFASLVSQNKQGEIKALYKKVISILSLMLFPVSIGILLTSDHIIYFISGIEYLPASGSLQILSIATIFSLYAYVFTQCVLLPYHQERLIFYATFISAIVNVLLNLLFIPTFGINGAAITTVIAEAIVFVLSLIWANRYLKIEVMVQDLKAILLGCIGIFAIHHISKVLFSNALYSLIFEVVISCFIYALILILTHNWIAIQIINRIQNKNEP